MISDLLNPSNPLRMPLASVSGDSIDEMLGICLEQMIVLGPLENPAELRSLLPEADEGTRHFVLIELIKIDMAMAAEAGQIRRIELYSDAFPDLFPLDSIPLDLVMEEIQLRKEFGENPSREEYLQRFPQFDAMLSHLSAASEATSAGRKLGPPPELDLGSQIDDFLLIHNLGKGAFANVYLAQQLSMRRLVALKVSRGKGDESQALAQFDHANIVRVFDQRGIEDQKIHLLYMQFHPGGTLADVVKCVREEMQANAQPIGQVLLKCVDQNLLQTAQAVPDRSSVRDWIATAKWPTIVAWMGVQLARALHDAHQRGVLHRDVKPANVLLSAEGIPKLADFNVSYAGAAGRAGAAATFGGSIGYMAPEHLRAIQAKAGTRVEKVQESADLYSLAVLLWELWQGHRPFVLDGTAVSWSDAIEQQLKSRSAALKEPKHNRSAADRVLEKMMRSALAANPQDRPASGAEMAGRLRLALHPEAANLFDPAENSLRSQALKISPWVVACIVILLPNMAAGVFNYEYNHREAVPKNMWEGHIQISWVVNSIFFPLGAGIVIWFASSVVRAVRLTRQSVVVSQSDIHDTLEVGHRAALIGGSLWLIAGIIFPVALSCMYPDFTLTRAVHLFVSSLICGGVAMIYPFFGMAQAAALVYYPRFVRSTMQDELFDKRASRIIRLCEVYLLIAAIIPLLGAALLVSSQSSSRAFMLTAIGAGVMGLLASAFAYRVVVRSWARMGEVLAVQTSVVPGES